MSLIDFIILLVVAGICGSLGQAIAGYDAGGCLVSIALASSVLLSACICSAYSSCPSCFPSRAFRSSGRLPARRYLSR